MKSDHSWLLGPDPAPKAEVVGVDGDAAKLEPATPIHEITALHSRHSSRRHAKRTSFSAQAFMAWLQSSIPWPAPLKPI